MNKRFFSLLVIALGLMLIIVACGGQKAEVPAAPAQTEAPVAATEAPTEAAVTLSGNAIRGGLLYDEWTKVLGVDAPEGDQPLWKTQTTNTRSGGTTWRCKECHGWDYLGKDGAYGGGSHQTGFVGVMQVAGKDPSEILAALKTGDHDFSAYMDDQALTDIALFLSENMLDSAAFITEKAAVGGDVASGETIYGENCADCHGPEGLVLNFGDESGTEYYGTIAIDNPWEFVHKARFGQPGVADMPALVDLGLTDQEYIDLLAYAQTFPTSSPVAEGGRLYDNWIAAIGAEDMTENQPLWATQTTNERTGNDTWRCKECHGWDFKGVEGRYATGSHLTGFPGVISSAGKTTEELMAAMKTGDHDFSSYLNDDQLGALVAFVQQVEDLAPYINDDKTVNGDAANGETLYASNCLACHGEDGKAVDFDDGEGVEFVGTVSADNPWEVLNKIQNGQPGEVMTAGRHMSWSMQDLLDILAYIQTLPIE